MIIGSTKAFSACAERKHTLVTKRLYVRIRRSKSTNEKKNKKKNNNVKRDEGESEGGGGGGR